MTGAFRFSLEPVGAIADLAPEWSAFDAAGGTSFFTSWLWVRTWLGHLSAEIEPLLLRARDTQRTVAMAIAVRRRSRRRWVIPSRQLHLNATGDPWFDCLGLEYNGFAMNGVEPRALWSDFLEWFRSGQTLSDEVLIAGVRDAGTGPEHCRDSKLLHRTETMPCFETDLHGLASQGGDLSAALSRNARQQLHRAMRLCEATGPLEIDEAHNRDEALAFFAAMKPLHIAHWTRRGKRHAFHQPLFERFHSSLITNGIDDSRVEMLRIRAGETVLGYLYNFRHLGRVYAFQSGFDGLDRRRPGYVCHALAIRHAATRGDLIYDFMAGSNRLKQSFASREYRMDWYIMQQPLIRFQAENALRAAKKWISRPRLVTLN